MRKSKGKGKHCKNIKIAVLNSNSEMPCRKHTKMKAELKREAKNRAARAWHSTDVAKQVIPVPKPCQTWTTGKPPHQQLATKAPQKQAPMKPCMHYALIAMWEICHFQKCVDLLIPLLPFGG